MTTLTKSQAVNILNRLEPEFRRIASVAKERQATAEVSMKSDTGDRLADIVTDVDTAIQTAVVDLIAKTPLVQCQFRGEEDTPGLERFAKESDYILSLDPVNGTANYADGSPHYNFIVGLAVRGHPHYTFCYYPATGTWIRIVGRQITQSGEFLMVRTPDRNDRRVVYSAKSSVDRLLFVTDLLDNFDLTPKRAADILPNIGSSGMFLGGAVQGFWNGVPSAHDGFWVYHYALARRWDVYVFESDGQPAECLDIRKVEQRPGGLRLQQAFLVLRP